MIEASNNIFALHGGDTTLLMRVKEYGLLEHLHFGERVEISDAPLTLTKLTSSLVDLPGDTK